MKSFNIKSIGIGAFTMLVLTMTSCDETTGMLGTTLSDNLNNLNIVSDTFDIKSSSRSLNPVINKSSIGYLGHIKDPQTKDFITGNFLTQFHTSENYSLPDIETIISKNELDGKIIADSCEIRLYYRSFFGDSLATMKVEALELDHAINEQDVYYSNFDPFANNLIREDGIKQATTYTLQDQHLSQAEKATATYINHIKIPFNSIYTDKKGNSYDNYGSYILQTYYEHPEYFQNSTKLINNVIPGFYFQHKGGIGSMAYVSSSALNVYFRYKENDSIYNAVASFAGTEEVLQASRITNSLDILDKLIADKTCTYLKTPAGIYTELTLPIDEILLGHENDTINSARLVIPRINDELTESYKLPVAQDILILPHDSIHSFFANNKLTDNKTSFLTSLKTTKSDNDASPINSYTFSNIGAMISYLAECKQKGMQQSDNWLLEHPNWNKVAIIPVSLTQVLDATTQTYTITKITNNMALSSTKLVGGDDNKLQLTVIYSRFNN